MDEAIIKYYRHLLKKDFPNAGELESPSVFIEAIGGHMIHCGNTGNYMQLYLQVSGHRIVEIKYLCSCEPVANVAVEVMCDLVKGMTVEEAANLSEEAFYRFLETQNEELQKKILGLLKLLKEGLLRYRAQKDNQVLVTKDGNEQGSKLSWDGTLSK